MITACLEDPDCKQAFPNLRAEYEALWDRLEAAPASVAVKNPKTGAPTTIRFGRGNFAEALRFYDYTPASGAVLPILLHRAYQGDLQALRRAGAGQRAGLPRMVRLGRPPGGQLLGGRSRLPGRHQRLLARHLPRRLPHRDAAAACCAQWPKGDAKADHPRAGHGRHPRPS